MKKLLIILILATAIFSPTLWAQANNTPDSSKVTFTKVYNDVKAGVSGLASALKVGAEHVYQVLIKQQVVKAITWCIILITCFISCIYWFKACKSTERWYSSADEAPTGIGVIRVFQIIISGVFLCVSLLNVDLIITGFINPEYGALKEVMEFIK